MPSGPLLAALQAVAPPRDGLAQASDVAALVVAVAVVGLAVVVVPFIVRLNRTVTELRNTMRLTLGPVSERARRVSDNVEFITQAVRTDVERLTAAVEDLTERLHQASDYMEERIDEFNALMEVVQSEAEDLFLDTAATVRGVKEGARNIADPERHPRPGVGPEGADPAAADSDPTPRAASDA